MKRTALILGEMRGPNLFWHAGKILYEKHWLYRRY